MPNDMIVFDGVSFSYGKKNVLKNFSLKVPKGGRICLFGDSGCGKSTALRLIAGLEKPKNGTLTVGSKNIRMVFQEDRLLPFLTARENIGMFGDETVTDEVIARLGIEKAKDEYPAQLSGGMARRAALARALAADGDIYIFDEPFNGLDEENVKKAAALINERTAGKTVVAVLHDRDAAGMIGCRVFEMS